MLLSSRSHVSLRDNLSRIFVKRPCLRQGFDGLGKLRVVFQIDLVPFGQAKHGDEDFLLDFALDPGKVVRDVGFGVLHLLIVQVRREFLHHGVVGDELLGDFRARSQEVGCESAHAALIREEYFAAQQHFLEGIELVRLDMHIGSDASPPVT